MQPVDGRLEACEFEAEVLAAAIQSRWPDRVGPELRAHAAHCVVCRDVAVVARAIDEARTETRSLAVLPDAGRVWWTSQLRAKREAARAATRPITATQLIAGACAVGLVGACFGATSEWFQAVLRWAGSAFIGFQPETLLAEHGLLITAAGVLFLLPAAAWLVLRRE